MLLVVPGTSCCPVMLSGGIPRLDMAFAQALWSEVGVVTELQAMVGLQFPSRERHTGKEVRFKMYKSLFGSLFKLSKMCID